jgi:hypothetical protein
MTGVEDSHLHTLAREAREKVDENLTKAVGSEKIEGFSSRPAAGPSRGRKNLARRKSHNRIGTAEQHG